MGLLDRLNLLIRSNMNVQAEDRHDPESALSGALVELEATLKEAQHKTAQVMRDERRLEREVNECLDEEERWEERAFVALKAGNEPAAREALGVKHRHGNRRRRVEEELDQLRVYLGDLLRGLDALEVKLSAVKSRRVARREQASSRAPRPRAPREAESEASRDAASRIARYERARGFSHQTDEAVQRWEALERRPERSVGRSTTRRLLSERDPLFSEGYGDTFEKVEASLAQFSRMERKIDEAEADAEASLSFGASDLDPDDPLYDPELADIEARFKRLEIDQGPNKKR